MTPVIKGKKRKGNIRDKVFFSAPGQDMEKIFSALKITPDVRRDRVAALKRLIDAGKYHVSSDDLAEKMIKEFLLELKK